MNIFKGLVLYLYELIKIGAKGIRKENTEFVYNLLKENPTLEEVKEGFNELHGIDINARFECNATLLSTAIEYQNDLKIIEFIVNQGFELNPSDSSPLDKVLYFLFEDYFENLDESKTVYYLDILKILLEGGAKPNHQNSTSLIVGKFRGDRGSIKLQIELLELFIEYDTDLNIQDEDGRSMLFYCNEEEEKRIVSFLLEHGASPNIIDKEGDTALQYYYKYLTPGADSITMVKLFLLYGWDLNNQNNRKQNFIFDVVDRFFNNEEILTLLLTYKPLLDIVDIHGKKVADYATGNIAKLLKEAGASSNYNEMDRELMSLVTYWNSKDNIDEVKTLLLNGANVNVSNNNKETPLYHAVYSQDVSLVKLLLSYQPNINVIDELYGNSILPQAVYSDNIEITKMLLDAGADIEIQSSSDEVTPLFYIKSIKMLKLLIKYGVNINAKDNSGKSVLSKIVTPNAENTGILGGDDDYEEYIYDDNGVEKIKLLLSMGIRLEEDKDGNTIFHDAARGGSVTFLKLLNQHKISHNTLNNEKESPLQFAVKFGHFEAVKYLIELGIDINTIDEYGATALYEAGRYEHELIEKYLIEKGADSKHIYDEETTQVTKGNLDYL